MRSSVSRAIPELPVVFTPSGTTSQIGTVAMSMSRPAGASHFGSVHREHTTPHRQISGSCWVKAVRCREVVCVFGHRFTICSPDVKHHVIILNTTVGVYRPAKAGLTVRNIYSLENTCVSGSAMLKSTYYI